MDKVINGLNGIALALDSSGNPNEISTLTAAGFRLIVGALSVPSVSETHLSADELVARAEEIKDGADATKIAAVDLPTAGVNPVASIATATAQTA